MSRTLVVGDVHGCSVELAELVAQAAPDRLLMVGDLFTKGPDPRGVWDLLDEHRAEGVLGNHDLWVLENWERNTLPEAAWQWLESLPLFIEGDGWLVVHAGLHPTRGRAGTTREMALAMRRWPATDSASFWWESYNGPGLVLHGHDAARGLVDRRPISLGLDTGCVYGGRLTGYLVEEDRLLSVAAHAVYRPVGGTA